MLNLKGFDGIEDEKASPVTKELSESCSGIIESLMRTGESSRTITLDDGTTIQLITSSNEEGYISNQAIIVDGVRYDQVPGEIMKYRDGGSIDSLFESGTKVFELYLPVQGNNRFPILNTKDRNYF